MLQGDATKDESLIDSGIDKAKALITALPNDADNLFVILTARQLNPNIILISRASDEHSVKKLKIAGANNVIMPDKLGGANMASLAMIPDVHELLSMMSTKQTDEFRIGELLVKNACNLGQMNLWQSTGCTVLGVKLVDGSYIPNPGPAYTANAGESLIVMGSKSIIEEARKIIAG